MIKPGVDIYLRERGIPHTAIGAVALAIHGAPRYSSDFDLMVLDPVVLNPSFWRGCSLQPLEINHPDPDDPVGGVVRFPGHRKGLSVDVIVGRRYAARYALESSEMNSDLGCPVVSPLGLTLLKLDAGGIADLQDLVALHSAQQQLTGWDMFSAAPPHIPKLSQSAQKAWRTLSTLISIQCDPPSLGLDKSSGHAESSTPQDEAP